MRRFWDRYGFCIHLERRHVGIYWGTPRIVDAAWIRGMGFSIRTIRSKW